MSNLHRLLTLVLQLRRFLLIQLLQKIIQAPFFLLIQSLHCGWAYHILCICVRANLAVNPYWKTLRRSNLRCLHWRLPINLFTGLALLCRNQILLFQNHFRVIIIHRPLGDHLFRPLRLPPRLHLFAIIFVLKFIGGL